MIAIWILLVVMGFALAVVASRQATRYSQVLALRIGVPPLVIGLTLVGIGTNLPEIANSVVASLSDHGDLNAGAAIGSVAVDVTLVLGLLPFFAGAFYLTRIDLRAVAGSIMFGLGLGLLLVLAGELSRLAPVQIPLVVALNRGEKRCAHIPLTDLLGHQLLADLF